VRAAVLGTPIAHSLSPVLHRAAYAELGLGWTYDAIECDEAGLRPLLERVLADGDWAGLSLTMPLKTVALALADQAAPSATQVGVANTLVIADGRATAYNTDVAGVRRALEELGVAAPESPYVLGGGGTSRAVLAALAGLGSRRVTVGVRRQAAALELKQLGTTLGLEVLSVPWPGSYRELDDADVVVSTTPAGATDPLAATGWRADLPLMDVLYAPWPTPLAATAERAGAVVLGGLAMLVGQAAEQVMLMTGRPAPLAAMRVAGEAALAARTKPA
jgi:shikimate dehydrogenase